MAGTHLVTEWGSSGAAWFVNPRARRSSDLGPFAVVRVLWLLLVLLGLTVVATHGRNVPYREDWRHVAEMTGTSPLTARWVWALQAEHRIVLPKLVMLSAFRVGGRDYRPAMILNVLFLASAAYVLVRAAESLRGRNSYADALFPLLFLHPGHYENVLWSTQVCYTLPTLLSCTLLFAVTRRSIVPGWPGLVGVAVLLLALSLSLSSGLILALAATPWLGACAVQAWRGGSRRRAIFIWLLMLVTLGLIVSVVPSGQGTSGRFTWSVTRVLGAAKAATLALGPVAGEGWPYTGAALLVLTGLTAGLFVVRWRQVPAERLRLLGFGVCLSGFAAVALAIGVGRASSGSDPGFTARYTTLLSPLLGAIALFWIWDQRRTGRLCLPALLLAAGAGMFIPNACHGLSYAQNHRDRLDAFEADLAAGWSIEDLAMRHAGAVHPGTGRIVAGLDALRVLGGPKYAHLKHSEAMSSEPLPCEPTETHHLRRTEHGWKVTGSSPSLRFGWDRPRRVTGVRVRACCTAPDARWVSVNLAWHSPAGDSTRSPSPKTVRGNGKWREFTFWLDAPVTGLCLELDENMDEFGLAAIVLLERSGE